MSYWEKDCGNEINRERKFEISEKEFEEAMDKRFSPEIYGKLRGSRVSIAGLGGLGSNIALMLARSGIGELHLVDFDVVDITNLNRQVYAAKHIGMEKTKALREIIAEINPYIKVVTRQIKVEEENVLEIFEGSTIVCEAFDNPVYKALLINRLLEERSDVTLVSGNGMAGYESSNQIQTSRVMKRLYVAGDGKTDAYAGIGLMSPRVSICAGHQANMVIRIILGLENA